MDTEAFVTREEYQEALLDIAYLKRRVTDLEDDQETIVRFIRARFPKAGHQLNRLLKEPDVKQMPVRSTTPFNQDSGDLTTSKAIAQCFVAKPVKVDPILSKSGIGSRKTSAIPASLRG